MSLLGRPDHTGNPHCYQNNKNNSLPPYGKLVTDTLCASLCQWSSHKRDQSPEGVFHSPHFTGERGKFGWVNDLPKDPVLVRRGVRTPSQCRRASNLGLLLSHICKYTVVSGSVARF